MNFAESIVCMLWLVFGLHCVFGSKGDANFKVRINEKGTRFSELIKINEKENTVRFMVPKHNDVDKSDILNDFNLNLTITRLPDKRVCYIKPLGKRLTAPRKLKSDMTYVRRAQTQIQKAGTLVSSTQLAIDTKMEAKDLPPVVVKFCAGFPIYRVREMSKDSIEIEPEERSSKGSPLEKRDLPWCERTLDYTKKLPCSRTEYQLFCKLRARSCVFWAKCNVPKLIRGASFSLTSSKDQCKFNHEYNSLVCCAFKCPTK